MEDSVFTTLVNGGGAGDVLSLSLLHTESVSNPFYCGFFE